MAQDLSMQLQDFLDFDLITITASNLEIYHPLNANNGIKYTNNSVYQERVFCEKYFLFETVVNILELTLTTRLL